MCGSRFGEDVECREETPSGGGPAATEAFVDGLGFMLKEHYRSLRASIQSVRRVAEAVEKRARGPCECFCADSRRALVCCYENNPTTSVDCHHHVQEFAKCIRNHTRA